jgi:hypothetical protein
MDLVTISDLKRGDNIRNEISTNIQSIGIGAYVRPCLMNEVPDGIITNFTFTHPDTTTAISNCAEWSEKVYVDATLQVRGTNYTFAPATGTVTFLAGSEPALGTVVTMECMIVPQGI